MSILNNVFDLMKRTGVKQTEMAEFLNVKKQTISEWKGGRSESYMRYLPQIAEFLGVTLDQLCGVEQKNSATTESDDAMRSEFIHILERLTDEQAESLLHVARILVQDKRDR